MTERDSPCVSRPGPTWSLDAYTEIPLRLLAVDLKAALKLADTHNVYTYDAYVIACANNHVLNRGRLGVRSPFDTL